MIKLTISNSLYEMANFSGNVIGENFELWVDERGKERNTKHSLPRFKPEANGIQLDIVIGNDGEPFIDKPNPRNIRKFKYSKDAIEFIKKFKKPLLMHWNKEIETAELSAIFRLVIKKGLTVDQSVQKVLTDDY